jgi:hypothetical protein
MKEAETESGACGSGSVSDGPWIVVVVAITGGVGRIEIADLPPVGGIRTDAGLLQVETRRSWQAFSCLPVVLAG